MKRRNDSMEQNIGYKIRLYREYRKMSQATLAELSGLSEVTIRMTGNSCRKTIRKGYIIL